MADRARRARRVAVAAAVGACVVVAAAPSASDPVTLTVSPSASVDAGTPVRLTAKARLQRGARLRITAGAARFAECVRSPCVATYRGRPAGAVPFRASVVAAGKVRAVSRTLTVRWAAPPPVVEQGGRAMRAARPRTRRSASLSTEDGTITAARDRPAERGVHLSRRRTASAASAAGSARSAARSRSRRTAPSGSSSAARPSSAASTPSTTSRSPVACARAPPSERSVTT